MASTTVESDEGLVRYEPALSLSGVVLGMSDVEYHARPELSSTGARLLLDSPARFKHRLDHPIKGAALDLGTITHALVLGTPDPAQVIEGGRGKTEREREARAAGKIPVLAEDYAVAQGMAEAVLAHKRARFLLEQDGHSEASVFATDPETGVKVRARFDRLLGALSVDLKTTSGSASAQGFGQSAARYGYPVQEAFYIDALAWATGEQRAPMQFIVVEKAAPHLVAVHQFDEAVRLVASELAAKARRIYADCLAADSWPGHGDDVIYTEIPAWWFSQNEEVEEVTF